MNLEKSFLNSKILLVNDLAKLFALEARDVSYTGDSREVARLTDIANMYSHKLHDMLYARKNANENRCR